MFMFRNSKSTLSKKCTVINKLIIVVVNIFQQEHINLISILNVVYTKTTGKLIFYREHKPVPTAITLLDLIVA